MYYSKALKGGKQFNEIQFESAMVIEDNIVQLCHGYDEEKFPFVIITVENETKFWLLNFNTEKRIPLIMFKKTFNRDQIVSIRQTSKFAATQDASKANHYSNLKEIIIHFKLMEKNNNGDVRQLTYCNVKLSSAAIKLLIKT